MPTKAAMEAARATRFLRFMREEIQATIKAKRLEITTTVRGIINPSSTGNTMPVTVGIFVNQKFKTAGIHTMAQ